MQDEAEYGRKGSRLLLQQDSIASTDAQADAQKNQADVKLNFNTSSTTSTSAVINEFNGILTGGELQVSSIFWACTVTFSIS